MLNWIAWWYRPGIDVPAEELAEVMVDIAMAGIRRSDERTVSAGPWAALALLKEDLTHLERTMSTAMPPAAPDGDASS